MEEVSGRAKSRPTMESFAKEDLAAVVSIGVTVGTFLCSISRPSEASPTTRFVPR